MKSRRKGIAYIVSAIFLFIFVLVGSILQDKVFSYDTSVAHPNIAELAARLYNDTFDKDLSKQEIVWIKQGAEEEDTPTRWLNHFYDPIYKKGLTFGKEQYSGKNWIINPKAQTNFSLGDQSWQRALSDYSKGDKEKSFKALGHVLHILADMTVPAHTREDVHVMPKDSYEDYVKNNWNKIYPNLKYNFIKVDSLTQSVEDLANISNNNFYSDDTVDSGKYSLHNKNLTEVYVKNNTGETDLYLKNNYGVKVCWFGNVNVWNINFSDVKKSCLVSDPSVLSDYSNYLIPKAIGYSAGVIKLFFEETEKSAVAIELPKFRTGLFGYIDTFVGNLINDAESIYEEINNFAAKNKTEEVAAKTPESVVTPKVLGEKINAPTPASQIPNSLPVINPTPSVPASQPSPTVLTPPLADSLEENFSVPLAPVIPPPPFLYPLAPNNSGGGGGGGSGGGGNDTSNGNASNPPSPYVEPVPVSTTTPTSTGGEGNSSNIPNPVTTSTEEVITPDTTPPAPPVLASQFREIIYTTSSSWTILGTCTTDTEKIISYKDNIPVGSFNPQVLNPEDYLHYWNYETSLVEGENTFSFIAEDLAENRSVSSTEAVIIRDNTPPTVPVITTLIEEVASSTQIIVDLKGTDENKNILYDLHYQIKDTTSSDWILLEENTTSTHLKVPTTRGKSYRFKAKAKDNLGNTSVWSEPVEVFVNWSGEVVINEIAWAGTSDWAPQDEWFELYNNTSEPIDLANWQIKVGNCTVKPRYIRTTVIQPKGYFLWEHDRDRTIDEIEGDIMYWYGYCRFKDEGEIVQLIKPDGTASDVVNASEGWYAGEAGTHYTSMERIDPRINGSDPKNWQSNQGQRENGRGFGGNYIYGSPRRPNSRFIYLAETQTIPTYTLTKENNPYILQAYVIPVGRTLRIEPGVIIKSYTPTAMIDVYGRLEILGTPEEPVIFTSGRDKNYPEDYLQKAIGSWSNTPPQPGDWQVLRFRANSTGEINNTELKYAGKSYISDNYQFAPVVREVIRSESSNLQISGADFHDSLGTSIYLKNSAAVITSSSFKNGDQAIESLDSNLEIKNSHFSDYVNQFWVYNRGGWPVLEDLDFATSTSRVLLDSSYVNRDVTIGGENNYYVVGSLEVQDNAKLTIKPGTTILLRGQGWIIVKGSLMSLGLPENPITFKAYDASRWCFLNFVSSTSNFAHTRIEGGGCPNPTGPPSLEGMIRSDQSTLFFDNVTLWNTALRPPAVHAYHSSIFFKDSYIGMPTKYDNIWQQMPGILQWEGDLTIDNTTFENLNIAVNGHSLDHPLGTIFWKNMTPLNFKNVDIWSFPVGWGEIDLGI